MFIYQKFLFNKIGISPVVATALLLVVSVVAIVGFQNWFTTFNSGVFVDVESDSKSSTLDIGIKDVIGTNLYINAGDNLSINKVEVSGVDCNFNGSLSGLDKIDLSACLDNMSNPEVNVVVFTNKGVYESYQFVDTSNLPPTPEKILNFVSLNSSFAQWFGGFQWDYITSIDLDSNGNIYVGGYGRYSFSESNFGSISGNFSSGNGEAFIFKFDSLGNYLWGQWVGADSNDQINDIAVDNNDNIYAIGWASAEIVDDGLGVFNGNHSGSMEGFILKLDSSGNFLWGQWIGNSNQDQLFEVEIDSNNDVYVGGSPWGFSDDGLGAFQGAVSNWQEATILKFDSLGNYLWGHIFGGVSTDNLFALNIDSNNNVYVGGKGSGYDDPQLTTINGTGSGSFLFKLDSLGNYLWGQTFGGSGTFDGVKSIDFDSKGNVIVLGDTNSDITNSDFTPLKGTFSGGSDDVYLLKFDTNGNYLDGTFISGSGRDSSEAVSVDRFDNVFIGGFSDSITLDEIGVVNGVKNGGWDGYVFTFNSSFDYLWGQWYSSSGSSSDRVNEIFINNDNVYVGGAVYGNIAGTNLGPFRGTYSGNNEGFFIKYNSTYK